MSQTARMKNVRSRRAFLSLLAAIPAVGCAAQHESDEPIDESEEAWRACRATSSDAEGPYFEAGAPFRATRLASSSERGTRLAVEGRLVGPDCKTPLKGYALDLWQADDEGNYYDASATGYRLRGKVVTDAQGHYRFETIVPGNYGDSEGIRPAHIHAHVLTPGGNILLTTQLYFAGDPYLGQADYCTRDRTCNSSDARRQLQLTDGVAWGTGAAAWGKTATFNAYLPRT